MYTRPSSRTPPEPAPPFSATDARRRPAARCARFRVSKPTVSLRAYAHSSTARTPAQRERRYADRERHEVRTSMYPRVATRPTGPRRRFGGTGACCSASALRSWCAALVLSNRALAWRDVLQGPTWGVQSPRPDDDSCNRFLHRRKEFLRIDYRFPTYTVHVVNSRFVSACVLRKTSLVSRLHRIVR